MKCSTLLFLAFLSSGLALLAGEPPGKLKVLLVTGGHGFEEKPFLQVFKENPHIAFTHATQGKTSEAYERPDLFSYDVVVLYDMVEKITDEQKKRFLALFDKGVGLVVMHHALVSYQAWPEFERIIGGKYYGKETKVNDEVIPKSDYQHDVDIPISIEARDHPITQGLTDFVIHDEIYMGFRVRPDVTPLITTTHPQSGKPLMWTRTEGKSRIVYLQLGHDHAAYENPNYRQLVARSIRWVAASGAAGH